MTEGHVETFHQDGEWYNRTAGEKGATGPFKTKAEAVDAGSEYARRHGREHRVRDDEE